MRHQTTTIICNDTDYFLRHRAKIADALVERGHDVIVISGGRRLLPGEAARWPHRFQEIARFGFHPRHDVSLAWATLRDSVGRKLDTLHLITLKPAVIGGLAAVISRALFGYPRRVVITIAGLGRLMSPNSDASMPRSKRWTERALRFICKSRCVHHVFETEHDRAVWVGRGLADPSRSTVVDGAGVNSSSFHPRQDPRKPGPIRVLFASRLLRSKGLDIFLEVADRLIGEGGFEFLVAGFSEAGDVDAYSARELKARPSIRFLGSPDDMPALLRSVDVVCLPTRYGEGVPRILIEAAATGIASIGGMIDGCRAIIDDGKTGFLVSVGNFEKSAGELADALQAYRDEPGLLAAHSAAALAKFRAGSYGDDLVIPRFIALLEGRFDAL